ncbi:hypothetical protein ACFSQ0_12295 [Mesonia sediminis]|uniref:Uncharacterized protein n=1 Tax=Mesonia sediminis TaxID=1703946 RepID=A0ABW5SHX1_9FLAO
MNLPSRIGTTKKRIYGIGEQLKLRNAIAQTYKLEIIAEVDGYKDYASVIANSPYQLQKISLNPSDQITFYYQAAGASSGYISIISTQTVIGNN